MFEQLNGTHHNHHHIRLYMAIRSDLMWWDLFFDSWNGVSLLRPARLVHPDNDIYADALGSFDCGAMWEQWWFQFEWLQEYVEVPIAPKKFSPIVMACVVWGCAWQGKVVQTNNEAVIAVVNSCFSKDPQIMHLAWSAVFSLLKQLGTYCIHTTLQGVSMLLLVQSHFSFLKGPRCRPDANQDTSGTSGAASHQPARLDASELGHLFRSCLQQV